MGVRTLLRFGWGARSCRAIALPFVGDGPVGMPVPAGILVVVWLEPLADLHDREHAAHLDRSELAESGYHRQRVIGNGHLHRAHLGYAARAHRHVPAADHARDLLAHLFEVDADIRVPISRERLRAKGL